MNTAEKVVAFLRKNQGAFTCDGCIAEAVHVGAPVNRILDILNPIYIRRSVGVYFRCGAERLGAVQYKSIPRTAK
jgi:hypothetical protein